MHRTLHVKFNKTQKMMYRFGFVNNVASKVVEADRQLFYNAIRRADVSSQLVSIPRISTLSKLPLFQRRNHQNFHLSLPFQSQLNF